MEWKAKSGIIYLPEGGSDFLCILFYPADFTQLVREEVIEAAHRIDEFKRVKCQVTVETDYSHYSLIQGSAKRRG